MTCCFASSRSGDLALAPPHRSGSRVRQRRYGTGAGWRPDRPIGEAVVGHRRLRGSGIALSGALPIPQQRGLISPRVRTPAGRSRVTAHVADCASRRSRNLHTGCRTRARTSSRIASACRYRRRPPRSPGAPKSSSLYASCELASARYGGSDDKGRLPSEATRRWRRTPRFPERRNGRLWNRARGRPPNRIQGARPARPRRPNRAIEAASGSDVRPAAEIGSVTQPVHSSCWAAPQSPMQASPDQSASTCRVGPSRAG